MKSTEQLLELISKEIEQQKFGAEPHELYEPLRYIMALGGKRLRPLLATMSYSLFKDDVASILPQAIAVEVFHNFTLMHDDIMDEAPLRRTKPTVHEKWNSNTAILSGDVMLVKAYELLIENEHPSTIKVLKAFNQCAAEVCEGQQFDMDFESQAEVTEESYLEMIRLKTAVLLGFSLEMGAMLAETDSENCKALRDFGINIGLGFQLKDDLLDVYADASKFGKQVGGDIIANKKTFLLISALKLANKKQRAALDGWIGKSDFKPAEKVKAVTKIYDELDIRSLTENKMNEYFQKGFQSLRKVNAPLHKKAILRGFAESLIDREK